jgi:flagellar hook protein FlgE
MTAMEVNLDARLAVVPPAGRSTMPDPSTYNNATSMTVYDAKGQDMA